MRDRCAEGVELLVLVGVHDQGDVFEETEFLIDPNTAVGVRASRVLNADRSVPMVTLATAHPVKFADAVERAGLPFPGLPLHLRDLHERPERCTVLDNDLSAVTSFIRSCL